MDLKDKADVIIMCAAVADYTPIVCAEHKMKKQDALVIEFEKNKGISLRSWEKRNMRFLLVLPQRHKILRAMRGIKLSRKNLDMIIANDVSGTETGFDSEYNAVSIYTRDGKAVHFTRDTKRNLADSILTEIAKISG